MKTTILQLEPHDDSTSVRDKMAWSKSTRVLLVWPRRGRLLRGPLDLLLVQRRARELGVQLALVTRDARVIERADALGIPIFSNARKAEAGAWRVSRQARRRAGEPARPPERPPLNPRALRELREQYTVFHRLPRGFWQSAPVRLLVFLSGVLAVLALVVFFLPGATVTIAPQQQEQQITFQVRASPEIRAPAADGALPASVQSVIVEGQQAAPTTGQASIPDQFAGGSVRFTNLTDREVDLPAGTVVRTAGAAPQRFALLEAVRVPAGASGQADAAVRAILPGAAGNVPAGQVTAVEGAAGLQVRVENLAELRGGSQKAGRAPTAQDAERLRAALLETLRRTAIDELRNTLGSQAEVLEPTAQLANVLTETRAPEAGQPADQLTLQIRAEFSVWTVRSDDLRAVSYAALNASLPAGAQPLADSLRMSPAESPVYAGGQVTWKLRAAQRVQAAWDQDQVVALALGRDPADAARALQGALALQSLPHIRLNPSWWFRMPYLPFRIAVVAQ